MTEGSRVRDLEKRLAEAVKREAEALTRESVALEQQAATAEVLRVISSSPVDVQPVFDTIVRTAVCLCEADYGFLARYDGTSMAIAAHSDATDEEIEAVLRVYPMTPTPDSLGGRTILQRAVVHIPDVRSDPTYGPRAIQEAGWRTGLGVPLLREGTAIGLVGIWRRDVRPFSDRQIALLQTFADQAVIALENVRLFKDLEVRNADLAETLERQTATAEILRVISQPRIDVQPVLDAILRSAVRLCDGFFAAFFTVKEQHLHLGATHDVPEEAFHILRGSFPVPLDADLLLTRAARERRVFQVRDIQAEGSPTRRPLSSAVGERALVAVPMLREGSALGVITVSRREARDFSAKQVTLLQTFADQAVIALENVRLFRELTEALDRQTATADILRVISRSPTDIQPVLDAVAESAARLCAAHDAIILRLDGDVLRRVAHWGPIAPPATLVFPVRRDTVGGRTVHDRRPIHVVDLQAETEDFPVGARTAQELGSRTVLGVPLLHEGAAIGAIYLRRSEVRPFADSQIALLETFAAQAVIAIENVRLFKELEAQTAALARSVEQLTALGEVGRAVGSTLNLEVVLATIVARAVELSGLDGGVVFEYDDGTEEFTQRAAAETGGVLAQARRGTRFRKGEGVLGRTAVTLEPAQVPDITVPGAYDSRVRQNLIESGIRAILAVPMVHQGRLVGCLGVTRNRPGAFPADTIELLRTFATQSALAIQNARLFHEIEDKSRQLEAASQHKSEFLANMSHELRTPLNAVIGFSEVLLQRMFGELNAKQDEYLTDIYASGQHLLSLINDILDLSKIEAGRMELAPAPFHLPTALDNAVTLVRERAARHGIALEVELDPRLGELVGDERKVKQVLLNLLSNAVKFTPEGGRISLKAGRKDGLVEVAVTDTGIGIAPEDQAAVFEEFRQVGSDETRKQEGTGLGLTLAKKFVELHGGRIWVESAPGRGSTFTFTLPVA
jgi:signal transduction histidine kinase